MQANGNPPWGLGIKCFNCKACWTCLFLHIFLQMTTLCPSHKRYVFATFPMLSFFSQSSQCKLFTKRTLVLACFLDPLWHHSQQPKASILPKLYNFKLHASARVMVKRVHRKLVWCVLSVLHSWCTLHTATLRYQWIEWLDAMTLKLWGFPQMPFQKHMQK